MVSVTAFFAGLLGLMFIGLSALVIMARGEAQATLGHGDHEGLKRRIRAHGNFAEYVPFALLLMGLAELGGTAKLIIVFMGAALLIARISHAYNILIAEARNPMDLMFRKMGMAGTLTVIGIAALLAIF